ncbi:MAG: heavy metal translocating P-type ATPase [Planctomycetes bacterium]|nr:heavy metal translocating P-type ATPase [Planctomycetota bacterium]
MALGLCRHGGGHGLAADRRGRDGGLLDRHPPDARRPRRRHATVRPARHAPPRPPHVHPHRPRRPLHHLHPRRHEHRARRRRRHADRRGATGADAQPRQNLLQTPTVTNLAAHPGSILRSPSAAKALCTHCRLPVPAGLIEPGAAQQFCCSGCRTAHQIIHECGLDAFYKLRESGDAFNEPTRGTDAAYGEYDDPQFIALYAAPAPAGCRSIDLRLEGVHCAACVWLIEKLPRVLPGVIEARLTMHKATVRIVWDPSRLALSRIARVLDNLGYPSHPSRRTPAQQINTLEDRRLLWRIAVAGAIAGNVMLMAVALYAGMFSGMDAWERTLFRYGNMLLGVLALAWPGRVFLRGAVAAVRTRTPHMDLPIALGLIAGGVAGAVNTIRGSGEIYFDSLTVLIFLLLVGRWLQHRQQRRAADALELLFSLTPRSARRIVGDAIESIAVESLNVGDLIEVRAGENLPADGRIVEGHSELDRSLLTGESAPCAVGPGDAVLAAMVNIAAPLRVRVEASGADTRLGQLVRLVEECTSRRAPIVQFADRIAGVFVIVVIALAIGTWGVWQWIDPAMAIDHAVALLIVACPCALGLATPMALAVGIGRAAKRHILIKGGDTLERLAAPGPAGLLLLDKTGTLTTGIAAMRLWHGDPSLKSAVLAIESQSTHPRARAIVAALQAEGVTTSDETWQVRQLTDGGIRADLQGRRMVIGSIDLMHRFAITIDEVRGAWINDCLDRGLSPVCVAIGDRIEAVIGFGDELREDARAAIRALRRMGWRIGIASGDHARVVQRIAHELEIDPAMAIGRMSPEDKLTMVERERERGPVVMIGDGVNDAAALAAATVGIAVHGGAEASMAAADVYLGEPGLAGIVRIMHAARRTVRAIHRNLYVSLGYNAAAVGLAMLGLLNPLIAAVLMPLSSLSVLGLSMGVRTFGEDGP